MAILTDYSYKDFTGQSLKGETIPPGEIIGSCFAQEGDDMYDIFPDNMDGVTLKKCNLDNVEIKGNNTVDSSSWNRNITIQNDLCDWICDKATKQPIEPIDKKWREKNDYSVLVKDIPITKLTKFNPTLLKKVTVAEI